MASVLKWEECGAAWCDKLGISMASCNPIHLHLHPRGKGRRVLELCHWGVDCLHVQCGIPFEAIPMTPSVLCVWGDIQKRKLWHDLSEKKG